MTNQHPGTSASSPIHNPGGFTIRDLGKTTSAKSSPAGIDSAQQRLIIGAVSVLVAATAVFAGWRTYSGTRAARAGDAFYLADKEWKSSFGIKYPQADATGKDPAAAKAAEAVQYQVMDVDAEFPAAVKAYSEVVEKFSGSRAAYDAAMTLGGHYFDHGAAAKAAPWFEKAADMISGTERDSARLAAAQAHETAGKMDEARKAYAALASSNDAELKGEGLLGTARLARIEGKTAEARETYEKIRKELAGSDAAHQADTFLANLK